MTRAELASQVGIDPSVLSRIFNLLNLAPEIQDHIAKMEPSIHQSPISERRIRELASNSNHEFQKQEFSRLVDVKPRARHKLRQARQSNFEADKELVPAQL